MYCLCWIDSKNGATQSSKLGDKNAVKMWFNKLAAGLRNGRITRGSSELKIRKTGASFDESWTTLTFNNYGSRLSGTPNAIIMSM